MPNSKVLCEPCGGTGYKSKDDGWVCPTCKGDKVRPITTEDLRGTAYLWYVKAGGDLPTLKLNEAIDWWLRTTYGIGEGRVDRTPEDI